MIALRQALAPAQRSLLQELATAASVASITTQAPAAVAAAAGAAAAGAGEPLCSPSTSGRVQGSSSSSSGGGGGGGSQTLVGSPTWTQRRQLFDFASGGDLSKKYDERKLIGCACAGRGSCAHPGPPLWPAQRLPPCPRAQPLPLLPPPLCLTTAASTATTLPRRYSPQQMFDVVAAVEHYSEFVPWCQRSKVVRRAGADRLEAELEVGFQMLTER